MTGKNQRTTFNGGKCSCPQEAAVTGSNRVGAPKPQKFAVFRISRFVSYDPLILNEDRI